MVFNNLVIGGPLLFLLSSQLTPHVKIHVFVFLKSEVFWTVLLDTILENYFSERWRRNEVEIWTYKRRWKTGDVKRFISRYWLSMVWILNNEKFYFIYKSIISLRIQNRRSTVLSVPTNKFFVFFPKDFLYNAVGVIIAELHLRIKIFFAFSLS